MSEKERLPIAVLLAAARLDALTTLVGEARNLAQLARRLAGSHGGGEREVEAAAAARHGDQKAGIGPLVNMVRHAGRFAAEKKYIPIRIGKIRVGGRSRRREQKQAAAPARPPLLEAVEVHVPGKRRHFEVVHAGAPEVAVGEVEAGGLDDVDGDAEAGGQAQDGAGVAGDVGLVERDAEGRQGANRMRVA